MNDRIIDQPTRAFWVVSSAALVWNLLGVVAYLMQVSMTPEAFAAMTPDVRALYEQTPAWATAAYAVAVFGGTLGCLSLLLRKTWATPLFVVSLLGILVQFGYTLILSDSIAIMGAQIVIMPLLIIGIGIFLIQFSRSAARRGILQ